MHTRSLGESAELVLDLIGQDPLGDLRRRALVELDDADRSILRRVHEALRPHVGSLCDAVLDQAGRMPEFGPYIDAAGGPQALRTALSLELSDLTGGDWDGPWLAERARIGLALADAGLPPDWFVAAMSLVVTRALEILWTLPHPIDESIGDAARAFLRVSQMELGIVLHARAHLDRTAMADLRAFARTVLESVPDGIVLCSPAGKIVEFNAAAERIFQVGRDEVAGKDLSDLLHEAHRADEARERSKLFDADSGDRSSARTAGVMTPLHMTGLRADGTTIPVEVTLQAGNLDGELICCASLRDISDRVKAENALRRSEANFRALIEGSPDAILVHRGGKVIYANPGGLALMGLPALREVVNRNVLDFLTPPSGTPCPEAAGRPRTAPFRRADGSEVAAEVREYALDFDGKPAIVAVVQDVTERHRLSERMLELDRAISIGSLAAAASHEINNPLTDILGNTHFARSEARRMAGRLREPGASLDPEALATGLEELARALDEAEEGAIRVRETVASLRGLAGRDDGGEAVVNLDGVIDEAVTVVWNQIRHRARLERQYLCVPGVAASRRRLTQVMVHLLLNAAQAIPEGDSTANEIRISTYAAGDHVYVEISDTGCGMTEAECARAFEPFYTTRSPEEATGLGLTICRQFVEAAGGTLTLASQPDFGTTVRVVLPAAESLGKSPRHSLPLSGAAAPCRILLVDDEPHVASAFRRVVEDGHTITSLTSARDALHQLETGERFDFVFCDLHMPDMSGMALYDAVLARWPELARRMVFLTGGAFTAEARGFLRRVSNPCLDKPFDAHRIGRILAGSPQLGAPEAAARPQASSER